MATEYKLKIDMQGGGAVDVRLNISDSTIRFSQLPEEMRNEDWASINDFLAACGRLMRNPRMLKAEVERET
jgi:hypothetical protein